MIYKATDSFEVNKLEIPSEKWRFEIYNVKRLRKQRHPGNLYIEPIMDNTSYMKCFENCKIQHENLSKADLIELIQKNNCATVSEKLLIENYSHLGLLNMLCGCLCGDDNNDDDGNGDEKIPPAPELIHTPPVGTKKKT